ncbi:MAG: sulfatase-like hydrolase/transferase, partial [bacterium]|nr:sulfatase-like hydrolase/transferase [bacterium]
MGESSIRIVEEYNSQGRGPAFESADVADNAYPDGVTAERALGELRRLETTPFFLAVGFSKPHLPFNAPKRYWNIYDPDDLVMPEHEAWPQGAPELALTNWGELRNYPGIPKQGPVDDGLRRNLIHGYRACISYTDAQVGRLLMDLEKLGLADDTVVILWGDHGWKLGDYGA